MNLEYLKEFRLANSRTQTEFAKNIGCPQSTYHYVEVGKTQLDVLQLRKLKENYPNFDLYLYLEIDNKEEKELLKRNSVLEEELDKCHELIHSYDGDRRELAEKVKKLEEELKRYKEKLLDILLEEREK